MNGVLIGYAITDILNKSANELKEDADQIRSRIDELTVKLGVELPVYLLFTKCDQLEGFSEFFEDLTQKQRDQIWGYTTSKDEFGDDSIEPARLFQREFSNLAAVLTRQRAYQLNRPLRSEERKKSLCFSDRICQS